MWSMILITIGAVGGFFVGRTEWSRNFKFTRVVRFSDTKYAVRCGALGMYVYKNFNERVAFPWHCKLSEYFRHACMVDKETCENYMNNVHDENVVD